MLALFISVFFIIIKSVLLITIHAMELISFELQLREKQFLVLFLSQNTCNWIQRWTSNRILC